MGRAVVRTVVTGAAGLVLGWVAGLLLIGLVYWVSGQLLDRPFVLKGLELALGVAGAVTGAVLGARPGREVPKR